MKKTGSHQQFFTDILFMHDKTLVSFSWEERHTSIHVFHTRTFQ